MTEWTAIIIAPREPPDGPMRSRLQSCLHPVAGRPLVWHVVRSLELSRYQPRKVIVLGPEELEPDTFDGIGLNVEVPALVNGDGAIADVAAVEGVPLVLHASALLDQDSLGRLLHGDVGDWIGGRDGSAAAMWASAADVESILVQEKPFSVSSGLLDPLRQMPETPAAFVVETRSDLARAQQRIRDDLVRTLMNAGATFLLPESVTIDVDVRIGRDTVIYPGVVIEGQTTIGDETVIGPGCRIIDSWIGSGVELKGWNYIAHTSVRNRAILEPYVRRGFE